LAGAAHGVAAAEVPREGSIPAIADPRSVARRLDRLTEEVLRDAPTVAAATSAEARAVREALFLEEVLASTSLAGYVLEPAVGAALLGRGVATGGHRLEAYEAVADYADAARQVRGIEIRTTRPLVFLRAEELLELHRRAMRRTGPSPGAWRERNVAALPDGLVPPPHWLVPREVIAFVDRFSAGPERGTSPLMWVAAAQARVLRIQPFDGGNGRVARLTGNLLLRRLGLEDAAFTQRRALRYRAAIACADSGDVLPLAELIAEALHESFARILATAEPEALRPLRALAHPTRLPALVKAAQRGRLRVVRRGTRFYTTAAWLAEYEWATRERTR
jgi:Fic/DOC family